MTAHSLEPDYVDRLAMGDEEARRAFATRFRQLLRIKIRTRQRGWDAQQVDDVIQETYVRVLAAVREGRIEDPARFGGFVSRVCDNVMMETGRSRARVTSLEPMVPVLAASDDPEAAAAAREAAELARQELASMPPRDRQILEQLLVDGIDKDEICRRFGVGRDHLRVIVHRAKQRFLRLRQAREAGT